MPKIIEDAKEKILEVAKKQVIENGYSAVTIRSVAKECQIGTGTIYNYFPSKDVLVASFLLEDWLNEVNKLKKECSNLHLEDEKYSFIYQTLVTYNKRYKKLFTDEEAVKNSGGVFRERHKQLRAQIVDLLTMNEMGDRKSDFSIEFVAEALLTWSVEDKPYEELGTIINKILK